MQVLEGAAQGRSVPLAAFAAATLLGVPLSAGVLAGGAATLLGAAVLVLTVGVQVLTQWSALAPEAPPAQRVLLLVVPLVSTAFCAAFPIGVTAYWLVSATWTLGQQVVLTRVVRP